MSQDNLPAALARAQSQMNGAKKDKKNPFFKSSYADLSSVFEAIKVPFAENGLAVSQTIEVTEDYRQVLVTTLMHTSQQTLHSRMLLPDIADPQKLGSAITYYRRYSLMAIAGIPAEDDDGNAASQAQAAQKTVKFITSEQVSQLEQMINGHSDIRELVLKNCNGSIEAITQDRFQGAVKWISGLIAEKEAQNAAKH